MKTSERRVANGEQPAANGERRVANGEQPEARVRWMSAAGWLGCGIVGLALAGCGRAPADASSGSEAAAPATAPTSAAASTAAKLPTEVEGALAARVEECTGVGGIPHTDKAVQHADLNGDGHEDYVLFAGWIDCENAASVYGDRAKPVTILVGDDKGGARVALENYVYDVRIEATGAGAKAWLTVSGENCGRPPAPDFASEAFCERPIAWNAGAGRFDFAPVSTVRIIG
ncbi:MAG: hypothetical protein AB7G76_02735 [Steroidobacteraceae bacterium]